MKTTVSLFPAQAGVILRLLHRGDFRCSFPRASGGDPATDIAQEYENGFSRMESGKSYKTSERIKDEGELYKVLSDHTSQEACKPKNAPPLFAKILPGQSGTEIGEWVQQDFTNPCMKGDKVRVSDIDNNV